MYLIVNLGISEGFGAISPELIFPTIMRIDYIRVYQPKDKINVGCDPSDFPTQSYIETQVLLFFFQNDSALTNCEQIPGSV
jgi:beta-glucan synthesis-associated protein KRE6